MKAVMTAMLAATTLAGCAQLRLSETAPEERRVEIREVEPYPPHSSHHSDYGDRPVGLLYNLGSGLF